MQIYMEASGCVCSCCMHHGGAMATPLIALRAIHLSSGQFFLRYDYLRCKLQPLACGSCLSEESVGNAVSGRVSYRVTCVRDCGTDSMLKIYRHGVFLGGSDIPY